MRTNARMKCFLFAPLILAGLTAFSYITMLLWNALLPVIFHLPVITFCQALGVLILSRLLFGGLCHHGHGRYHQWGHPFRDKWTNMTSEEREEFLKRRHEFRSPWGCCSTEKKGEEATGNVKG